MWVTTSHKFFDIYYVFILQNVFSNFLCHFFLGLLVAWVSCLFSHICEMPTFPFINLFLVSFYCCQKHTCVILIFLNTLMLVLFPNIFLSWRIFHVHLKRRYLVLLCEVFCFFVRSSFFYNVGKPSVSSFIYIAVLSIIESGSLKFPNVIVELSL